MVQEALDAAVILQTMGRSIEVIDPRTLVPLDFETILQSIKLTGRLLVVDEAHDTCSTASQIAALAAERAWPWLKAPIRRLTVPDQNIPFSVTRNWHSFAPSAPQIVEVIQQICD